ncbi:MAG: hypothetical protein VB070_14405 [Clostridiaceae bacterium]|nr:hypothetical protein [Clostridiaceae bacterium]
MYKVSIPVIISNENFTEYFPDTLEELKRAKADRVFLCASRCIASEETKKNELKLLKEYIPKFTAEGIEAGIWIDSLGHGSDLLFDSAEESACEYTRMRGLKGFVPDDSFCPLDQNFERLFCDWIRELAATGTKMIMLDDDYRMAFRGGDVFCCCDLHMKAFEKRLNDKVTREGLYDKIFGSAANKYRYEWLHLQRDTLVDFAQSLRRAVNESDKTVRLGHCACLSTWDLDGVDSITLAKAFAGDTKPFLRLIGASYWAASRAFNIIRIGSVINYERLQQHWCGDEDIEIFSECDSYPRPRYYTPAAYVEGLDMAMRAAGGMDGALKYMIDYTSAPCYEKGYIDRHVKNRPLYKAIEAHFGDKTPDGLRIFEPMNTLAGSNCPGELYDRCIPASLRFASDLSMPVTYGQTNMPAIIFGDGAAYADEAVIRNGAVIDITAAIILADRGIDTGISVLRQAISPSLEIYDRENERVYLNSVQAYDVVVKSGAKVLSQLYDGKNHTGAFLYENCNGQKYLVYPFAMQKNYSAHGLVRNYCRQRQLIDCIKWLCGKNTLAICPGNPDLYMLVKSADGRLAVGLWNFFEDSVLDPVVHLSEPYSHVQGINCTCRVDGDKVYLSDIPSFSFVGFELY